MREISLFLRKLSLAPWTSIDCGRKKVFGRMREERNERKTTKSDEDQVSENFFFTGTRCIKVKNAFLDDFVENVIMAFFPPRV